MLTLWPLLLAACGRGAPPERLQDCADAPCQSAWVLAHLDQDPQGTASAIAGLRDPVAQLALVELIGSTQPQQLAALCDELPASEVRGRCSSLAARGHLWKKQMSRGPSARESAANAGDEGLADLVPARSAAIWQTRNQSPISVENCTSVAQLCQTAAAVAALPDSGRAAGFCLAIEDPRWQSECFFKAAEAAYTTLPDDRIGDASALCLGAGDYARHCLRHLTWVSARRAPNALSGGQSDWDAYGRALDALASPLAPDPALQSSFLDIAWANGLRAAYDGQVAITGRPLDFVPAERQPDVRAAAVWRLWNLEAQQPRDLAAWVARAAEVLADRDRRPGAHRGEPREHLDWLSGWSDLLPEERALPRVSLLGMGHRTTSEDVPTDLAICVLEAAGHASPPSRALLREGQSATDPRVRWTALRLLALGNPRGSEIAAMARDPDPVVAARAKALISAR